jgi:hypothetical protein
MILSLLLPIFLSGLTLVITLTFFRRLIFGSPSKYDVDPVWDDPPQKDLPCIGDFGITIHCLETDTYLGIYTIKICFPLPVSLLYSIRNIILNDLYLPLLRNKHDFRFQQVGDDLADLLQDYAKVEISSNLTEPSYDEVMEYMPNVKRIHMIIDVKQSHLDDLTFINLETNSIERDLVPIFRSKLFLQ